MKRLLIPFVLVSTLQFLAEVVVTSAHAKVSLRELPSIYIWPHDQFWFLPALFFVFMIVGTLDAYNLLRSVRSWAAILAVALCIRVGIEIPTSALSAWAVLYLLPAFLLGCGLRRFAVLMASAGVSQLALVGFAAAYAVQQYVYFEQVTLGFHAAQLLSICVAFPAITLLFKWRRSVAPVAYLGRHSYVIYLFHIFGTAGARILLSSTGAHTLPIVFVVSMTAGLAFPIALRWTLTQGVQAWRSLMRMPSSFAVVRGDDTEGFRAA